MNRSDKETRHALFPLPTGMILGENISLFIYGTIPLTYGDDPSPFFETRTCKYYSPYLRG